MISNVTILLLLVCGYVTANGKPGPLKEACMKIREGSTAGFKHQLPPIILPKGQAVWEMPLPKCFDEGVGVDILVCDEYNIPSVKITESSTVLVQRRGNLDTYAIVHITLHCSSPKNPLTEQKTPPPL